MDPVLQITSENEIVWPGNLKVKPKGVKISTYLKVNIYKVYLHHIFTSPEPSVRLSWRIMGMKAQSCDIYCDRSSVVVHSCFTLSTSSQILQVAFSWNLAGMVLRWCCPAGVVIFQVDPKSTWRPSWKKTDFKLLVKFHECDLDKTGWEWQATTEFSYFSGWFEIQHGGHASWNMLCSTCKICFKLLL